MVLIDEVDAHLHPTWQERIGEWFIASFPEVQFLVTTHSPIICRAARNSSIWRLATPGSGEQSTRITGKDFDRLVNGNLTEAYGTEHFGRDVGRSEASAELLKELAGLNRREMRGELSKEDAARLSEYAVKTEQGAEQSELDAIRSSLLRSPHPTVWEEMKRQAHLINEIQPLFVSVPAAMDWRHFQYLPIP